MLPENKDRKRLMGLFFFECFKFVLLIYTIMLFLDI